MCADSEPVVELCQVSKEYRSPSGESATVVLRDVSLRVAAGETLAIVGPSGSGKSTLLNLIGALDAATAGSVRVAGRELGLLNELELAAIRHREIGFVFQQHHLLPQCNVLENVLIPTLAGGRRSAPATAIERARSLLERVGLRTRIMHRPGQLSGGECQRVALIRALINEPRLLLGDEPTGALDRANSEILTELLLALNREQATTLILVTHAETVACRMERRLHLVDGTLAANGPGVASTASPP